MRVLAVTNIYPSEARPAWGTFVEQQVTSLRRLGLEVDLLYEDRAKDGMRVYFGMGRKIQARIEQFHPDVVHIMYGGVMADQATRAVTSLPTVVSFCGSDLYGERFSGGVRWAVSRYGVFASHNAARRASGIIVMSEGLRQLLPDDVDRSKVRIIPTGVDLDRFQPLDRGACREQLGWDANRFHVLFPANTGDPVKQPSLAVAAIERLNWLGISAELHFIRGVRHSDVGIWINACDALLLTSRHEGSPNIVKETLACNVPVVSVDVGDVRQRITGVDGCYLAESKPGDLAAKLSLVHSGPRRSAGREAVRKLSLDRVARRIEEFYAALCKRRAS